MKKLLALTLALLMALTCMSAFADTVYTKVTVDPDVVKELMTSFGVPEDQMAIVDPILALVNALGVNVTTVADGAQIDLDVNGKDALSLGFGTDETGATVASTLFPNYIVTISQETIAQMMEQFAANMPAVGGEGGMDMNAMMETFGGYYQRWMEAVAAAGQPGDPVSGDYEFDGHKFDTMVPITVDMATVSEATKSLMDELLNDQAAMAAIKGMAQGMMQNSGQAFDEANFEANFKAGFEDWLSHFPDTVTAEYYCNGEEGVPFYLTGDSKWGDEIGFTYYMLFEDEKTMEMGFTTSGEAAMEGGFTMQDGGMTMYLSMQGMYIGLVMSFTDNQFAMDIYFMNADKPLVSITVETAEGSERTLSLDTAGKTVLAVEDVMNDQSGEAVQGLAGDFMANGLGTLMQLPEIAGLMSLFTGNTAMAG